jgi:hypothetical protein
LGSFRVDDPYNPVLDSLFSVSVLRKPVHLVALSFVELHLSHAILFFLCDTLAQIREPATVRTWVKCGPRFRKHFSHHKRRTLGVLLVHEDDHEVEDELLYEKFLWGMFDSVANGESLLRFNAAM